MVTAAAAAASAGGIAPSARSVLLDSADLLGAVLGFLLARCDGARASHTAIPDGTGWGGGGGADCGGRADDDDDDDDGRRPPLLPREALDGGRTCARRLARASYAPRLVCRRWSRAVGEILISVPAPPPPPPPPPPPGTVPGRSAPASAPRGVVPFGCAGEADLRRRVEDRRRRRGEARSALSERERGRVDSLLSGAVSSYYRLGLAIPPPASPPPLLRDDGGGGRRPSPEDVVDLLERGADCRWLSLCSARRSYLEEDWEVETILRTLAGGPTFAAPPSLGARGWVVLQELMCSAGDVGPPGMGRHDYHETIGSRFFLQVMEFVVSGRCADPDAQSLHPGPRYRYRKANDGQHIARRQLALGLARVILHVSALDRMDISRWGASGGDYPSDALIWGGSHLFTGWEFAQYCVIPFCDTAKDENAATNRRFATELLASISANNLESLPLDGTGSWPSPPSEDDSYDCGSQSDQNGSWMFCSSDSSYAQLWSRPYAESPWFLLHTCFGLGLISANSFLLFQPIGSDADALHAKLWDDLLTSTRRVLSSRGGRRTVKSFLRCSPSVRKWVLDSSLPVRRCTILRELVRMKRWDVIEIFLEREPVAMRSGGIAEDLLAYARSKKVGGKKERVVAQLQHFLSGSR